MNKVLGKRMNINDVMSDSAIRIPIIQRDYAQGRENQEEVRNTFIDKLFEYLEDSKVIDLDFVYGNIVTEGKERFFIPVDGQQRLTTLALLYWYLANLNNDFKSFQEIFCTNEDGFTTAKFSYETRTSSKEFFNELFRNSFSLTNLKIDNLEIKLSDYIKNRIWFSNAWLLDPTVKSVLTMVDTIHKKFYEKREWYSRLPILKFLYLDLNENKLTDDLYIKMNSRGVSLTPFENFKAHFEKLLDHLENDNEFDITVNGKKYYVNLKKYFTSKLDKEWANIIWEMTEQQPKEYDRFWSNLFRMFAVQTYASQDPTNRQRIRKLLDKKKETYSFYDYELLNVFTEDFPGSKTFKFSEVFVCSIVKFFGSLPNKNPYFFQNLWYSDREILKSLLNTDYADNRYVDRLKFYAFFKYQIKENKSTVELEDWIRVLSNLIENSAPYDSEQDFINAIKSIDQLIQFENNFYEYLKDSSNRISSFDSFQVDEERLKAVLITYNDSWKALIYKAEEHQYFKGQIGFLLYLSDVKDKILENKYSVVWDDSEDLFHQSNFENYYQKTIGLFDSSGLKKIYSKDNDENPQYLFERALLTQGNYLLRAGKNRSFLRNVHRDISWKRFLKMDREEGKENDHSRIIRQVFDAINPSLIKESLQNVIASYNETDNWKSKIITNPLLLSYLGEDKYIRIQTNQGLVLFKGERMHGAHAELFSYDFYIKHLKTVQRPFTHVWYYFAPGEDYYERPCAVLDELKIDNFNFALEIFFDNKQDAFGLKFFDRNHNLAMHVEINTLLSFYSFSFDEKQNKFIKVLDTKDGESVYGILMDFSSQLNNLHNVSN